MKKIVSITGFFFLFVVVSQACTVFSPNAEQNADGNVLFRDDFSNQSGQWDVINDAEAVTDYIDGSYRILVNDSNWYYWSNPGKRSFNDVRMEVDVNKAAGPDENDMGLICRYQDKDNFYFGVIGSDGFYAVFKIKDGNETLIGMEEYGFDDKSIKTGNNANHIRLDCIGSKLSLYANNTLLVEVEDTDFPEGNVGLLAGTYDTPGVDVYFDNFVVKKP
jgi:hypothetical protein